MGHSPLFSYIYLGTGDYLINFLNALLVALRAAKTMSNPLVPCQII